MKCTRCNQDIKSTDKFCGNCGTKIQPENRVGKFLIKNKVRLILIGIIVLMLLLLFNTFNYLTSPSYVSKKYFDAIANNDIDKIYSAMNIDSNDFTSKELLKEKINKIDNPTDIKLISKQIINNEALITYSYVSNNELHTATVSLTNNGNKYLFFKNWIVNSGKVANKVTIKMPTGSTVLLDNKKLTSYKTNSSDKYDTYVIDHMIAGEYEIEVTLPDTTVVTENINITSNDTYTLGNITLSDENKATLNNETKALIQNIYNSLINDITYDQLNYDDTIKDLYKDLRYSYKISNLKLNSINIDNISINNVRYNDKGNLIVEYELEYNYNLTYNNNSYDETNRDNIQIEYSYDNGYVLENINDLSLRFPIRK